MVTASFTGFIRTILIIIAVYYLFKFLMRLFAPMLIQQMVKKAEQNFNNMNQQYNQQAQQQQYQSQSQQQSSKQVPKEKKKVGEYIDFEELD